MQINPKEQKLIVKTKFLCKSTLSRISHTEYTEYIEGKWYDAHYEIGKYLIKYFVIGESGVGEYISDGLVKIIFEFNLERDIRDEKINKILEK